MGRDIYHSKGAGGIADPNFPDADAYTLHGLPIEWLKTDLDSTKLNTRFPTGGLWELAHSGARIAQEDDTLHDIRIDIVCKGSSKWS